MGYANMFRRYEMKLQGVGYDFSRDLCFFSCLTVHCRPSDWKWRDLYLPHYEGPDITVTAKRRTV